MNSSISLIQKMEALKIPSSPPEPAYNDAITQCIKIIREHEAEQAGKKISAILADKTDHLPNAREILWLNRLQETAEYAGGFIGCRCDRDDCGPGDCWPCRMMKVCDLANPDDVTLPKREKGEMLDNVVPISPSAAATTKALAGLDAMADKWAESVKLDACVISLVIKSGKNPDGIVAFIKQAYAEGLYEGRISHETYPKQEKGEIPINTLAYSFRQALENIREIWVGSECGKPVHAQEAYAINLCKQMYREAVDALRLEFPKRESVEVLPFDVEIGSTRFRKGVKLETLINAARRWHDIAVPPSLDPKRKQETQDWEL